MSTKDEQELSDKEQKAALAAVEHVQLQEQLQALIQKVQAAERIKINVQMSPSLLPWLRDHHLNMVFTTGAASKLMMLSLTQDHHQLVLRELYFNQCRALLCQNQNTLYLTTRQKIWRLYNAVPAGKEIDDLQRIFIPQSGYITGELGVCDLAIEAHERLIFVNPLFSCLATVSPTHSFTPLWKPAFISQLVAENRCGLSGVAMLNGIPKYVTAAASTDSAQGWQQQPFNSGILIDVPTNEIVLTGLERPCCPRFYNEQLWLAERGSGYLGYVDLHSMEFKRITLCPGHIQSVRFHAHYAVVSVGRPDPQEAESVSVLQNLAQHNLAPTCGVVVIDLNSGDIVGQITFDQVINEIPALVLLRDVYRSAMVGLDSKEMGRMITVGPIHRQMAPTTRSRH